MGSPIPNPAAYFIMPTDVFIHVRASFQMKIYLIHFILKNLEQFFVRQGHKTRIPPPLEKNLL